MTSAKPKVRCGPRVAVKTKGKMDDGLEYWTVMMQHLLVVAVIDESKDFRPRLVYAVAVMLFNKFVR
jgi:hypothetical protein